MGRRNKRNAIAGQFAARPIAMLESPAYRVISRAAHQVLARIEIEHAHHGGVDNGRLPITYAHFQEYGLHLCAIAPAIRELETLGFIEVTEHGCAGNAEFRRPNLYRLTYRHTKDEVGDGTHEWRRIETIEMAEAIAKAARQDVDPKKVARGQKQNFTAGLRSVSLSKTESETSKVPLPETSSTG